MRNTRIVGTRNACPLGRDWFGDGQLPSRVIAHGSDASVEQAIGNAASTLLGARRALVYLAGDLSCETQGVGVGIADQLHASLDTLTTATARSGILAAQRRGRATATLGEVRNRADTLLFWGVDPARRYPRYTTRYAPDVEGLFVPDGRSGRLVIGVDVGESAAPADVNERVRFSDGEEVAALTLMRAAALGRPTEGTSPDDLATRALGLARRLMAARYAVIVHDGESSSTSAHASVRAEALVTLAQALNRGTRCALSTLRGGNNRSGADAVLTWQTGYPLAVDFARGVPRYRPAEGAGALLESGAIDVALVLGAAATIPPAVASMLAHVTTIIIGPRASESGFAPDVAIDTGVAGIHEGGIAMRMDEVPLPLRPSLAGATDALRVVTALAQRLHIRASEHAA
ncbi:MAG TPA: hypothetical protein VFW98_00545 [Gemmatimonadaceae bacterium]|nr:hypothetical protein [Gemmatimonadaceae bacterium]